ncbi:MAG: hypothetical protein KDA84_28260, partial [Planctomycetaceae bacterium]|nr:hypothetical protein [Planctomycetaceae bacterium]
MGDTRATDSLLRGIETAKSGNKLLARLHLLQAVELAPRDPNCWLWLAWVAESPSSAMHSLQRVLDEHPNHELAQLGMKWASAMADYEYQDVTELPTAETKSDDTAETDPCLERESAESESLDVEPSDTETWEVDSEEDGSDLEPLSVIDTQEDELEDRFEFSADQGDQEEIHQLETECSADTNAPEPEPQIAQANNECDENSPVVLGQDGDDQVEVFEDKSLEDQDEKSSTNWFTEDESVETESYREEPRFAVDEDWQDKQPQTDEAPVTESE